MVSKKVNLFFMWFQLKTVNLCILWDKIVCTVCYELRLLHLQNSELNKTINNSFVNLWRDVGLKFFFLSTVRTDTYHGQKITPNIFLSYVKKNVTRNISSDQPCTIFQKYN